MSTVAKRGSRGLTVFGRDPSGRVRTRHLWRMADILAHGSQTIIPPTPHPVGMPYIWTTTETLLDTPIAALPIIDPDIADKLAKALMRWVKGSKPWPIRPQMDRSDLTELERERQHRYALAILDRELSALASMASDSGRNQAAFRIACRVGRWAHHGIIARGRLIACMLEACERNGLVRDDSQRAVLATIVSGLAKSAADALPDLGARGEKARP